MEQNKLQTLIIDERRIIVENAKKFLRSANSLLNISSIIDVRNIKEQLLFEKQIASPKLIFLASHVEDLYKHEFEFGLINELKKVYENPFIILHSGRGKPQKFNADVFISLNQLIGEDSIPWINSLQTFITKRELNNSTQLILPIQKSISVVNKKLWHEFRGQPDKLRSIDPHKFEEVVAELLEEQGYKIILTPKYKDGGKDIYAYKSDHLTNSCFLVECKRYFPPNKVGVDITRQLYGLIQNEKASGGVIVTTSFFTSGAKNFAASNPHQLFLKDYKDLSSWLTEF